MPAAAQIIPPRYAGSDDPDVFRKQFEKKVTKVMKRDGYRIEELSHELLMKFTIDTLGRWDAASMYNIPIRWAECDSIRPSAAGSC